MLLFSSNTLVFFDESIYLVNICPFSILFDLYINRIIYLWKRNFCIQITSRHSIQTFRLFQKMDEENQINDKLKIKSVHFCRAVLSTHLFLI